MHTCFGINKTAANENSPECETGSHTGQIISELAKMAIKLKFRMNVDALRGVRGSVL